ncbi:MAG: SpoIVB peptidase S55 domain-containing protein [Bryobacteraceae bacterium]
MVKSLLRRLPHLWIALLAGTAFAAPPAEILPLKDVRRGTTCTGRTVFQGEKVEEFRCEILGVLENTGPKQSVILARLSGGPLEETGVLQGMSGSPVYVDGKLVGALAYSFPFSRAPIAGIRPIEEMLDPGAPARAWLPPSDPLDPAAALPAREEIALGATRLAEISTPLWFSGFSRGAVEQFAPRFRAAGFEPVQGTGGGRAQDPSRAPRPLQPGEMISVQLMTGDMSVGADGTVTHVSGRRIYAFGHRFLGAGETEMPFARAEVLALLPSLNTSFKICTAREWLGAVTSDSATAVAGELNRRARMLSVRIRVTGAQQGRPRRAYQMEVVDDRLLAPILTQMAVFSALEATERTAGISTVTLRGRLLIRNGEPLPLSNMFAAELGAPNLVSAAVAAPVAALLQSGFDALRLAGIEIDLEVSNEKRQIQLDGVWSSKRSVRPGEMVDITALYLGESGVELTRKAAYPVPVGAPPGPLYFTVTDGPSANLAEFRQFLLTPPRSPEQLRAFLTRLHPNDRPYLRVWRSWPTLQVQGENLPMLPPSAAAALMQSAAQQASSLVAEIRMDPAPYLFSGTRTIQVEVKE